jgi:hypothetical protein
MGKVNLVGTDAHVRCHLCFVLVSKILPTDHDFALFTADINMWGGVG